MGSLDRVEPSVRPAVSDDGKSEWICWIERTKGLVGSLLGQRKHAAPQAVQVIQSVLMASPGCADDALISRDLAS